MSHSQSVAEKLEFCENQFKDSQYFIKDVNEFLPLFSLFPEQLYEGRLDNLYTVSLSHL